MVNSATTAQGMAPGDDTLVPSVMTVDGDFTVIGLDEGTFYVRPRIDPGLVLTTNDTFFEFDTLEQSGTLNVPVAVGVAILGSIDAQKFNDVDGDGTYDPAVDTLQNGVEFTLDGIDGLGMTVNRTATSDDDGNVRFVDLIPGSYTLSETVPSGQSATTATSTTVTVASGEALVAYAGQAMLDMDDQRSEVVFGSQLQFGNFTLVTLSGYVFDDTNANGIFDSTEVGIGQLGCRT